jgi:protein-tyrosine phosphatase
MAEVVLRAAVSKAGLADLVMVDSAGTGDWHIGQQMNKGALDALRRHGYDGSAHRARQIEPSWFRSRDVLLAMDRSNESGLLRMGADRSRLLPFLAAGGLGSDDVPDPYGGEPEEFDHVLGLIETAVPNIVAGLSSLVEPRTA